MGAPVRLGDFIAGLQGRGQLARISAEVDCKLEITALTEPVMKAAGPALLFEKIKGSAYPLVINLFGGQARLAAALGGADLDEITGRLRSLMAAPAGGSGWRERLALAWPKLRALNQLLPRQVKSAPCQEVIEAKADLRELPVLTCWPGDAGPFITLPQVISAHPQTGVQNWGMYRMQVFDGSSAAVHWHRHKGGAAHYEAARRLSQKLPLAVALGGAPAGVYAACAPWPDGLDEALLTGFLLQKPLELVKARQSSLLVPAEAEFILEGYVDPAEELALEGPFGDHTGFYSPSDYYPRFHLTSISRRRNPIYPATIVGKPPMEDYFLGMATERLFLPLLQMALPEIVDYHLPPEGVFHNLALVAIRKTYPGQAFKVMHALWGQGQMMFAKMIVVVDEGVDLRNHQEVWWYALSNLDPSRDLLTSKGPADALDHACAVPFIHGKIGLDGTRKIAGESAVQPWPQALDLPPELKAAARAKLEKWLGMKF
jgi:4-hydroxy-3-polyprenylbenzoate decarboxylase